ncbi:MAG TPA: hypothetical protein VLM37_03345 [Fibrobacteraceae bacterium]|nr:hypothetical protein [Fibrobacteraceae bacterium]
MLRQWFRRRCSRLTCLNLLFMLALIALWWCGQALPVFMSLNSEEDLFFGMVHEARQSPLFGRISFRINDDDSATFRLWMNPANRERFDQWFGPQTGMRIRAKRNLDHEWIVTDLDCTEGGLDRKELTIWRWQMASIAALVSALSFLGFIGLWREYHSFYRFRPWFRIPK